MTSRVDTPAIDAVANNINNQATVASTTFTTIKASDHPLIREVVIELVSRKPTILDYLHRNISSSASTNNFCIDCDHNKDNVVKPVSPSESTTSTNSSCATTTTASTSDIFRIYENNNSSSSNSNSMRRRRRRRRRAPLSPSSSSQEQEQEQEPQQYDNGTGRMASDDNHLVEQNTQIPVVEQDDTQTSNNWRRGERYDGGCGKFQKEEDYPQIWQQMQSA